MERSTRGLVPILRERGTRRVTTCGMERQRHSGMRSPGGTGGGTLLRLAPNGQTAKCAKSPKSQIFDVF
jgi:hypothetical protein